MLEVKKFVVRHENHDQSVGTYMELPQQRRLDDAERQTTSLMLSVGGNKTLIQNHLMKTTNKRVKLRDLHNIAAASKTQNTFAALLDEMQKIPGYT
jgi:hypothetical protein